MKTENLFVSVNDGKEISRDLPWFSDNPNQGRDANHVAIRSNKRPGQLADGSEARPCCTQCTVPKVRNGDSLCAVRGDIYNNYKLIVTWRASRAYSTPKQLWASPLSQQKLRAWLWLA